jgi:hypothetical protein
MEGDRGRRGRGDADRISRGGRGRGFDAERRTPASARVTLPTHSEALPAAALGITLALSFAPDGRTLAWVGTPVGDDLSVDPKRIDLVVVDVTSATTRIDTQLTEPSTVAFASSYDTLRMIYDAQRTGCLPQPATCGSVPSLYGGSTLDAAGHRPLGLVRVPDIAAGFGPAASLRAYLPTPDADPEKSPWALAPPSQDACRESRRSTIGRRSRSRDLNRHVGRSDPRVDSGGAFRRPM